MTSTRLLQEEVVSSELPADLRGLGLGSEVSLILDAKTELPLELESLLPSSELEDMMRNDRRLTLKRIREVGLHTRSRSRAGRKSRKPSKQRRGRLEQVQGTPVSPSF